MQFDRKLMEALFSTGPVAVFAWEPVEGSPIQFASASVEGILGYSAEELTGRGVAFSQLVHPDDISRVAAATREAAMRGLDRLTHEPYRVRHAGGHHIWVSDTTMILRDDEGRMERIVGSMEDVTQRYEQGIQLEQERDRLELDPQPFDLGPALEGVYRLFSERAAAKELDYRLHLSPRLAGWVRGDALRLRQVLANLVSNALEFTSEGSVWMEASTEQTSAGLHLLTVRVGDTGRGIADTAAICESFEQGDNSIARSHGGTGLGLAISKQLVELMDGFIEVQGGPDHGTVFTVHLPLEEVEPPAEYRGFDAGAPLPAASALVVDDNFTNRTVLVRSLEALGIRAEAVSSGDEAIEACGQRAYDIVFLDLHMPGRTGLEVAQVLRTGGPPPVLVCVSADAFRQTREACLASGLDGFLPKPFRSGELRALLQRLLRPEPVG